MNITTIIELENEEVEKIAGAKFVFSQDHINEHVVETCVEYLQAENSNEIIQPEDAMKMVFDHLKQEGIIPQQVEDFSFEMPSCGQLIRKAASDYDIPQKVILSYMF